MDTKHLLYGFHYPLDIINGFQTSTTWNMLYEVTVIHLIDLSFSVITLHKFQTRDKHEYGLFLKTQLFSNNHYVIILINHHMIILVNHNIIISFRTKPIRITYKSSTVIQVIRHPRRYDDSSKVTTPSWVHTEVHFSIENHDLSYLS